MDIKDVKLIKGMSKEEVNGLISEWLLLEDDVYMGDNFKHNWICKCGNQIRHRMWRNIRTQNSTICKACLSNILEQRYKKEVEKSGEYEYIRSFRKGDILPNGRIVKRSPYIQIKHLYCGGIFYVLASDFINRNDRCSHCCQVYENSIAYHIEVELGEPLDKYWDFEKNTVNPYHIYKNSGDKKINKVWMKCQNEEVNELNGLMKKDYHESYEVRCTDFSNGSRCSYCGNHKVNKSDSFAFYCIINTDPNFLDKYWDYEKNAIDPWEISISSNKDIWIKCQNEEVNELNGLTKNSYHDSYKTSCNKFVNGRRCPYCNTFASKKVHPYDSFGYHNLDKAMSWHPDNDISPFRVGKMSNKKYKFICDECGHVWDSQISNTSNGKWCPVCASSKGEKKVKAWLDYNNIKHIHDEPYFNDLVGVGGNPLRPDFILPNEKIWIEYDGEFHYEDFYKDGSYERLKIHDKLKEEYAKDNGWKMIRIPYWEFDNVEEILEKEIR